MAKARATAADFGASATRAGTDWSATGKKFSKAGREISNAGSLMNRRVTLPLVALGAGAIKTAIDFESAFTGVRKTIDATESQYRELEDGIKAMAERLPASVEEISAVAEAAGQLGVKREAILGFTETMLDLGETTNLTADMAANSLARLANITKMPQTEFDRLGATIVDLGNKGASTEAEITEMALRIAGAGSTVGMTEAQILGFAESLSSVGIRAEAGGSSISKVFIEMANAAASGGADLERFADVAGMSSSAFKTAFEDDAAGATITFIEGLSRLKKEGVNVFQVLDDLGLSEIRVRDALLRAAGASDLFRKSQETSNAAWRENNALSTEAEKRYATNAAKLEILKNKFRNIMATFGNDMMPVLKQAAEALSDLAKWFNDLDPAMRKNILKWGAIAIAVGPFVRILGSITTLMGGILRMSGGVAKILGKIGGTPLPPTTVPTRVPGTIPPLAPAAPAAAGAITAGGVAAVGAIGVGTYIGLDKVMDEVIKTEGLHRESVNSSHALMMAYFKNVQEGHHTLADFREMVINLATAEGVTAEEGRQLVANAGQLQSAFLRARSAAQSAAFSVNALESALRSIPTNIPVRITYEQTHSTVAAPGTYRAGPGLNGDRAMGGPVAAGGAYLVGERGPEVLRMGRYAGHITPNHQLGGTIYLTIYADSTTDGTKLARRIRSELKAVQHEQGRVIRAKANR